MSASRQPSKSEALNASFVEPELGNASLRSIGLDGMFVGSIPVNMRHQPNPMRLWLHEPDTKPVNIHHAPFELDGASDKIWQPTFFTPALSKKRAAVHEIIWGLRHPQGKAAVKDLDVDSLGSLTPEEYQQKQAAIAGVNGIVEKRLDDLEPITPEDLKEIEEINVLAASLRANIRDRTNMYIAMLNRTIAEEPKGIMLGCNYEGRQEAYKGKWLFAELKGLRILDEADFGVVQVVVAGKNGKPGLLPKNVTIINDYSRASKSEAERIRKTPTLKPERALIEYTLS